ncbi:hypothetical protein ACFVTP_37860 [Streptomyces celluloflavus]|uniref:hypothetical protein n=1 Tax=Streptomyces celluloflavus TaxID=58344 RepID=UPI0036DE7FFD
MRDVEVVVEGSDSGGRGRRVVRWGCRRVGGDVSWVLDVCAGPEVVDRPGGRVLGRGLAGALGRPVLFEGAVRSSRPGAYWVATPAGRTGRVRLYGPGEVAGREGFVLGAAELPIAQLPHVPVDFDYEVIGDAAGGRGFAGTLRAVVEALRECCPGAELELRGSLAGEGADRYSDIDLRWTVPAERFAYCVARVGEHLDAVLPVLSARSDPDAWRAPDRRLLFFFFRGGSLFRRLDLEIRAAGPGPVGAAPAGGGWPVPVSALANALGAVKAVRRGRSAEEIRGLLDRGFARLGSADRATGRWAEDVVNLVDTAEGADPRAPVVRALAARIRYLVAVEFR